MFHPFTSLGFVLGSILFFEVPFVHGHPPAQAPIGGTGQSSLAHSGPLDETGPLAPISRARPLQEVFQIHAPVLTTAGPLTVDEDASDDGWVDVSSDGDAAMNGAHGGNGHESGTDEGQGACTVVLMEHSFGQSYGRPFVGRLTGRCWLASTCSSLKCPRTISASPVRIQSGDPQSHRHVKRPAV